MGGQLISTDADSAHTSSGATRWFSSHFRVVCFLIGVLLTAGAILKLYIAMAGTAQTVTLRLTTAFFALAKLCLAGWHFWGASPLLLRNTSMFIFGSFAAYALGQVVRGQPSCGCFGTLDVPPLLTFLVDLVVVLALAGIGDPSKSPSGESAFR